MTYGKDMAGSARRHLTAAAKLHGTAEPGAVPGNKAVAGYLYGLAGELALKEMMRMSGMREQEVRRDDPFYAHFPGLKALLRDCASGRRQGELMRYALAVSLFQNWSTDMRYGPSTDIKTAWIDMWKEQAESLVEAMNC